MQESAKCRMFLNNTVFRVEVLHFRVGLNSRLDLCALVLGEKFLTLSWAIYFTVNTKEILEVK